MHTAGVLWCVWLVTAVIRVQGLPLPTGCRTQELGGKEEDFTASYPLNGTLNFLLKSPTNSWRKFSFGFETSSNRTIGALTFTNEDTVALTLNNQRDNEQEVVKLSKNESLHLCLEVWTLLTLSLRDRKLTVAVKDVLEVVFHLVDASPFDRVFAHVSLGNYIDIGINCTPGSRQIATTTSTPPTHLHYIPIAIIVVIILALLAAATGLCYCWRRRRNYKHVKEGKTIEEEGKKMKVDAGDMESAEDTEMVALTVSYGVHVQGGQGGDQDTIHCSQGTMHNDNGVIDRGQQDTAVGAYHVDRLSTIHQAMSRDALGEQDTLNRTLDTVPDNWAFATHDEEDKGTSFQEEGTESSPIARDQRGGVFAYRTRSQKQQQAKASGTVSTTALEPHMRGSLTQMSSLANTAKTHTYEQPTASDREHGDDFSHCKTDTEPAMNEVRRQTHLQDTASEKIADSSATQLQGTELVKDNASSGIQLQGTKQAMDNVSSGIPNATHIAREFANITQISDVPMETEGIPESWKKCQALVCEDDVKMADEKMQVKRKREDTDIDMLETKRRRQTENTAEDTEMSEREAAEEDTEMSEGDVSEIPSDESDL